MKAAGKPTDAPAPESEDIAKLLRALNEDLKADPIDDVADLDDDEADPKPSRGLPLGKIAAALIAAAGIGFAVVMLDPTGSTPTEPVVVPAAPATPQPSTIARAPAPAGQPQNTAPEPMIARAPAISPLPTGPSAPATPLATASSAAAPAPPPPVAAPLSPPPALKVPEPPALPPIAAPIAAKPTVVAKLPEPPPAAPPAAAQPAPLAPPAATPAPVRPPAAAPAPRAEAPKVDPAPAAVAPPPPAATAPPPPKTAETGALQAMLAPPKEAREVKRAPAKPADTKAADAKPAETKTVVVKPAEPAAPMVATTPGGHYAVQAGSFHVVENADVLLRRLQGGGFTAYTVDWTDSTGQSWRAVRVGGYADAAAAKRAAADLKSKLGLGSVVVTTR